MPPKADSPADPTPPLEGGVSGKWVIIGILAVALAAAGGSWWFRYSATHRAAEYWGPQAARLIRDAPLVTYFYGVRSAGNLDDPGVLKSITKPEASGQVDVSKAHGMAHLRNALLEDQNFKWESPPKVIPPAGSMLRFRNPATNEEASIIFALDCNYFALSEDTATIICCEPIASGLRKMFSDFEAVPPIVPPKYR